MHVKDKAYKEHSVFGALHKYMDFYEALSMSIFSFVSMGTKAICNIDTYVYSSMQGTIESIKVLLLAGRINDAYALLRKYYDSVVINVYSNLYLKDNFSSDNLVVEKIDNWVKGAERLPEYRVMSQYIRGSDRLKTMNALLYADDRYKLVRDRCNDHTHYNFFRNVMLNDNEIYLKNRGNWLEKFGEDVRDIFVLHLGYMFFLNDHYMMSSDYLDALDCGVQPEEGSQYWVASFVQNIFSEVIAPARPDILAAIQSNSAMQLD